MSRKLETLRSMERQYPRDIIPMVNRAWRSKISRRRKGSIMVGLSVLYEALRGIRLEDRVEAKDCSGLRSALFFS